MLDIVGDSSEYVAKLEVVRLYILALAEYGYSELLFLDTEVILVNALYNASDFEDAEGRL